MKWSSIFLVLGACFIVIVAITSIVLWRTSGEQPLLKAAIKNPSDHNWQVYYASGEFYRELSAYALGLIAILVFLVWIVVLASRLHKNPISPQVLAALRKALKDDDYRVRSKAAVGLSELSKEESSHHLDHNQLDDILISVLKDDDYRVRSKVVEGLTEVELEPFTHHKPDQIEDALLKDMAQAYK